MPYRVEDIPEDAAEPVGPLVAELPRPWPPLAAEHLWEKRQPSGALSLSVLVMLFVAEYLKWRGDPLGDLVFAIANPAMLVNVFVVLAHGVWKHVPLSLRPLWWSMGDLKVHISKRRAAGRLGAIDPFSGTAGGGA